jgi:integrase
VKSIEFPQKVKRGSVVVKIYRTPSHGCDSFTLSYYQDGVRKRPTFPSFEKAKAEAENVAGRLASSDTYTLKLSSADVASYTRARELLDPLGIAIETAAAIVADAKKLIGDTPIPHAIADYAKRHRTKIEPKAVSVVTGEFMEAKRADGASARYLQCLKYCMGKFAGAFKCNIGSVTSAEIDDWLRRSGLSPRSRNNLRNSVQTLFSFAKARRYLPKDHDEIEAVPVVKDRDGAIEVFTPAELVEILNHCGERLIPFYALGAFAGVRHAEIQRLEWKDIRFDDGIIEIHAGKAKTASRRTVPILDNLRQWLMPHRKAEGLVCAYRNMAFEIDELVKRINKARRAAWAKAHNVSDEALAKADEQARQRLAKAREKGALRRGEVVPGAETAEQEGWTGFAWKHNALRHSFISYRVAAIQNVNQVALEAGNSPQMIFRHYRELVRAADARAWFALAPGKDGKIVPLDSMARARGARQSKAADALAAGM